MASGETPTVDRAAAAASISRARAYRYFPNQRALLAAAHLETTITSLLPENARDEPLSRLDIVVEAYTAMILSTEARQPGHALLGPPDCVDQLGAYGTVDGTGQGPHLIQVSAEKVVGPVDRRSALTAAQPHGLPGGMLPAVTLPAIPGPATTTVSHS